MKTQTKEIQTLITPKLSLKYLKDGNIRFQNNLRANRNLIEQVKDTSKGDIKIIGAMYDVNTGKVNFKK